MSVRVVTDRPARRGDCQHPGMPDWAEGRIVFCEECERYLRGVVLQGQYRHSVGRGWSRIGRLGCWYFMAKGRIPRGD